MKMRAAVFLDRDDTLIANREVTAHTDHPGDLFEPGLVRLLPGVEEGVRRLRKAGFVLVVVSNQGAVARGRCLVADVEATNARMRELIAVDAVYFCPYHPRGVIAPYNVEHPWRKPAPGMILHAAAELHVDLSKSWMIGDAARDIEAAVAAGIDVSRAILIGNGGVGGFVEAVEVVVGRGESSREVR